MATVIKTHIIQIGNSQGIRIPKTLLEQAGLGQEVELEAQENQIIIRTAYRPRQNWEEQFQRMAEQGDDALLDGDILLTTSDDEEWEW